MKNIVKAVLAGAAIVAGLLGAGGTAHASPNDAMFLQVLAERGIYSVNGPDYGLIETARGVCVDLMNGVSFESEVIALQRMSYLNGGYLTPGEAGFFIGASRAAYCPWMAPPAPPQLDYAV